MYLAQIIMAVFCFFTALFSHAPFHDRVELLALSTVLTYIARKGLKV